jgi:hypothetical protein
MITRQGGSAMPIFALTTQKLDRGDLPTNGVVGGLDQAPGSLAGDVLVPQRGCACACPVKHGRGSGGGALAAFPVKPRDLNLSLRGDSKNCGDHQSLIVLVHWGDRPLG